MIQAKRILLVDDDPAIRSSLAFALELEDFEVETFETGELLAQRGLLPDDACLVLDYKLPGQDGLSLLRQLRARGARLPAVLITSNPPAHLRRATVAAGATLVEKPLLCDALSRSIRSLIDVRRD